MKLLLDIRPAQGGSAKRGIGTYVNGLMEGLLAIGIESPEIQCLTMAGYDVPEWAKHLRCYPIQRINVDWNLPAWLEESAKLRGELSRLHYDVYHHTSQFIPPLFPHPTVLTMHDAIPILFPHGISRWEKLLFRLSYFGAHRAREIITVSMCSKSDLARVFRLAPDHITPIYHGVNQGLSPYPNESTENISLFARLKLDPASIFVLYAGGGEPRKDMPFLLNAFSLVRQRWSDLRLIIAGSPEFHQTTRKLAESMGIMESLRFTGHASNQELATLYSKAFAYLQPAKYEGFGLPPLEAMSLGCPVIARNNSSLPEVLGDAAMYLSDDTPQAMADLIIHLREHSESRKQAIVAGLEQARRFTWEETARQTTQVYKRAGECQQKSKRTHA